MTDKVNTERQNVIDVNDILTDYDPIYCLKCEQYAIFSKKHQQRSCKCSRVNQAKGIYTFLKGAWVSLKGMGEDEIKEFLALRQKKRKDK